MVLEGLPGLGGICGLEVAMRALWGPEKSCNQVDYRGEGFAAGVSFSVVNAFGVFVVGGASACNGVEVVCVGQYALVTHGVDKDDEFSHVKEACCAEVVAFIAAVLFLGFYEWWVRVLWAPEVA